MGRRNNRASNGFTLTEAIVSIGILMVIMIALLTVLKPKLQIDKARDSQRKADLNLISKAIEDYLNDNPCYPPESALAGCGDGFSGFSPYLNKVPCDPTTERPYYYENPDCQKFAVYANLVTENINKAYVEVDPVTIIKGNFAISSPTYPIELVDLNENGEVPTLVPTAVPTVGPRYACFNMQGCQLLVGMTECTFEYSTPDCVVGGVNMCDNPANICW